MATNKPQKLLRIAIVVDDSIQEERLIQSDQEVSLGSADDNTFVIKGAKKDHITVFSPLEGGGFELHFSRQFGGRIEMSPGDGGFDMEALSQHKDSHKSKKQYRVTLPDTARGKIELMGVSLLFQFVAAPVAAAAANTPAIKGGFWGSLDWPFVYIMLASLILLGGGTISLDVWWKVTGQYYYNPSASNQARLYDLIRSEVAVQEEKKEQEPEEKEEAAEVAEGDIPEDAPPPPPAAPEPKVQPKKEKQQAKLGAKDERKTNKAKIAKAVEKKTFLHVLGSSAGDGPGELDTLRAGVHQENLDSAFAGIDGGVTMHRQDGAGSGGGSGPEAVAAGDGDKYKSLSNDETGGNRIATAQVKQTEKKKEVKVNANVKTGNVAGQQGTGTIDKTSVASVFARRKNAIKTCYESALKVDPNVKGKVVIRFTIGAAGRITTIKAEENTTGNPGVAACIVSRVKSWRFDKPSGGDVTFSYPFILESK